MEKPTWIDKILHFFCKLFKKDFEEMSDKLKKEVCGKAKAQNICNEHCYCCAWNLEGDYDYNRSN